MYKFTNGIVVFDEETKNEYIKAGFILVSKKEDDPIEGQITIDEAIEEEINEIADNDNSIERKPERSKKTTK